MYNKKPKPFDKPIQYISTTDDNAIKELFAATNDGDLDKINYLTFHGNLSFNVYHPDTKSSLIIYCIISDTINTQKKNLMGS